MMKKPFFSIIIPTYNRSDRLAECLKALVRLNYPRDSFEVIVVDDGSEVVPDNIWEAVQYDIQIKLITQTNAGPAAARNSGALKAKGDFLVFTDDDCRPQSNWLSVVAEHFNNNPDTGIGGKMINALPENLYSTASQLLIDYLQSYYNRVPSDATFLTTSNLAVAKNAFFDANGFDTTFPLAAGEDREFCARWRRQGRNLDYIPEAIVLHAHELSFRSFIRQHFNYGQGAYYYHKIQAEAAGQSIHVEPVSFYWRLLRYPWYKKVQSGRFWISALMALSQVANAIGFFYTMASRRN